MIDNDKGVQCVGAIGIYPKLTNEIIYNVSYGYKIRRNFILLFCYKTLVLCFLAMIVMSFVYFFPSKKEMSLADLILIEGWIVYLILLIPYYSIRFIRLADTVIGQEVVVGDEGIKLPIHQIYKSYVFQDNVLFEHDGVRVRTSVRSMGQRLSYLLRMLLLDGVSYSMKLTKSGCPYCFIPWNDLIWVEHSQKLIVLNKHRHWFSGFKFITNSKDYDVIYLKDIKNVLKNSDFLSVVSERKQNYVSDSDFAVVAS